MEDSTLVTFEVTAPVALGETVCICGDHLELGGFNRHTPKEMFTDANTYPVWRLNVMLPQGVPRRYKYMTTGFRHFREWEPTSDHVREFVPEGETMVIQDEYGKWVPRPIRKERPIPPQPETPMPSNTPTELSPLRKESIEQLSLQVPMASDDPHQPLTSPKLVPSRAPTPSGSASASSTPKAIKETKLKRKKTSGTKRLALVAFHLPVRLTLKNPKCAEDEEEEWEAEWDQDNVAAKTEDSVADEMQVTWIGAVTPSIVFGVEFTFHMSPKRIAAIEKCLKPMSCVPVFLDPFVYTMHYSQFCKTVLWDIFHNVLRPRNVATEGSYENGFLPGNQAFADATFPLLQKNDIVWVHDYHLMLVPKLLRAKGHEGPIIFFLHVPFPTSEIFRTLPMRHELLEGMLSSSTIGFHTFNHGRHFLTACRRFLGAQSRSAAQGTLAVEHREKRVLITISHLGVDPQRLSISTLPSTLEASKKIKDDLPIAANFQAPGVIFGSLDEMQRLKGVPLKLLAFERFLSQFHNKWKDGQARFILWTVSRWGSARNHDVQRSTAEVRRLVQRINEQHGPVVVHREFDSNSPPTLADRVALWLSIDIYVSTAVSEGLNLFPLEFMYCRTQEEPGIVIVSEFSASSSVLNGAVRVNCYDIGFIAKAMDETARMPKEERQARRARDIDYITAKASQWTRHVITEVLTALENDNFSTTIAQMPAIAGSGMSVSHTVQCKPLKTKDVIKSFSQAKRRVFFLDFGGTLVEREEENLTLKKDFLGAMGRGLSASMKQTLQRLCADEENNVVFIVSGDTRTVLTRVFYDLLSGTVPLGLVAHSGLCIRLPMKESNLTRQNANQEESVLLSTAATDLDDRRENNLNASGLNPKMNILSEKHHLEKLQTESGDLQLLLQETVLVRSLSEPANQFHKHIMHQPAPPPAATPSQGPNSLIADWIMTVDISKEWSNWMREAGIIPILRKYTWTTVGTFYRTSGITTLWDYTFADPEWGLSQANFMILELEAAIANANLSVVVKHNKSVVQLLPKSVDKGSAVRRVLSMLNEVRPQWQGQPPDFCLCLGDDSSDEQMFKAVHQYYGNYYTLGGGTGASSFKPKAHMFTATVGRKPTSAAYYIRDCEAVQALLGEILDSHVV